LDWLVLRDILKQPAISWMPQIRGWVGGVGRVERRVGGLTMLSDTGNQVMCAVG